MAKMSIPRRPDYYLDDDKDDDYLRIVVEIPGLVTRRTNSIRFKGIRPKIRRAARNADIIFAAGNRQASIDVTLRLEGLKEPKKYALELTDLPAHVKPPPKSFYEIRESSIMLYLHKTHKSK